MKGHGGAAKTGGVPCGRPGKNCQTQKEPNKQAPAAPALSEAVCLLLLRVRDCRRRNTAAPLGTSILCPCFGGCSRGAPQRNCPASSPCGCRRDAQALCASAHSSGGARRIPELCLPRGAAGRARARVVRTLPASGRHRRPLRPPLLLWAGLPGVARDLAGHSGAVQHPELAQREVTFLDWTLPAD